MDKSNGIVAPTQSLGRAVQLRYAIFIIFLLVLVGFSSLPVFAGQRQQEAHEHGAARLNVALEGDELVIEFVSPAADIVGFEHEPVTREEKAAIGEARRLLMAGTALFNFPEAAQCVMEHAEVASDFESHNDDHEKAETGHGHDHAAGSEQADSTEHDSHGDFRAEYHFHVGRPEKLTSLEVLFTHSFPKIDRLDVQLVTSTNQTMTVLSRDSVKVEF